MSEGKLYIIATPIGNLEDITLRAIRILKESDLILCENSKNSSRLLENYQIETNRMSYFPGKTESDFQWIFQKLERGESLVYISDAGTPGISDPGSQLVRQVRKAGYSVIPIPGPSAFVSLLSVSGIQSHPSHFLGFLPEKKTQRKKALEVYKDSECAILYYESVHRIKESLEITRSIFIDAEILIGRELTKIHEEIIVWKPHTHPPVFLEKGEFVVLINNHVKKIAKEGRVH
jgi:16S rRNA (cytidine1402-2'-O)-methyltransferase